MKFKDLMTGNILDAGNVDVIEQFKKHTDRYEPVCEAEVLAPPADERRSPGRPKKVDTE